MAGRLPPLSTLRAFEAVVRLGSVGRAAEELGRTHGAISKQLRSLHADAGLPLFDKAGTGLKANAAGRDLAAAVAQALDSLSDSYARIVSHARAPVVQVACSATFAMRWLVPHMAGFSKAHPDVRIQLSMTSAREMRDERDADLVILWDLAPYPAEDRARAIRLGDAAFGLAAAPGYVATDAGGRLSAPRLILHDHTRRASELWREGGGADIATGATQTFPHTHLAIEAAVAGLGVALVERRLVQQELNDGRLVAPAGFVTFADGFVAIPHRSRTMSSHSRLFVDWLAGTLRAGD